ncbi:MAG TPA: PCRF domain-containing protein, partial [Aquifex aeolicus]|nr:PCRF domain-containing protein [Aquifex aeolicus]
MLKQSFLSKLDRLQEKYKKIQEELSKPEVIQDVEKYKKLSKELKELQEINDLYERYKKVQKDLNEVREILKSGDKDLRELAEEELERLNRELEKLEEELKLHLIPKDPNDK